MKIIYHALDMLIGSPSKYCTEGNCELVMGQQSNERNTLCHGLCDREVTKRNLQGATAPKWFFLGVFKLLL